MFPLVLSDALKIARLTSLAVTAGWRQTENRYYQLLLFFDLSYELDQQYSSLSLGVDNEIHTYTFDQVRQEEIEMVVLI